MELKFCLITPPIPHIWQIIAECLLPGTAVGTRRALMNKTQVLLLMDLMFVWDEDRQLIREQI